MIKEKKLPGKFGINNGLLLGAVMIIISVFIYANDMAFKNQQWPTYIYYVVFPIVIFYTIYKYKIYNNGVLSLRDAMKAGLIAAIISALIYTAYVLLFNFVIDPEYNLKIIDFASDQIALMDAPVEQKELLLKVLKFFTNPINGSLIWIAASMFFGLIYSLVAGLIMREKQKSQT